MAIRIVSFLFLYAKHSSAGDPIDHFGDELAGWVRGEATELRAQSRNKAVYEIEEFNKDPKVVAARQDLIRDEQNALHVYADALKDPKMVNAAKGLGKGVKELGKELDSVSRDQQVEMREDQAIYQMKGSVGKGIKEVFKMHPNLKGAVKGAGKGVEQVAAVAKGLKKDPDVQEVKQAVLNQKAKEKGLMESLKEDANFNKAAKDLMKTDKELSVAIEKAKLDPAVDEATSNIVKGLIHSALRPRTAPQPAVLGQEAKALGESPPVRHILEIGHQEMGDIKHVESIMRSKPEFQELDQAVHNTQDVTQHAIRDVSVKPEVVNAKEGLGKGLKGLKMEVVNVLRDPNTNEVERRVENEMREELQHGIKDIMDLHPNLKGDIKGVGKGVKEVIAEGKGLMKRPDVAQAIGDFQKSEAALTSAEREVERKKGFGPYDLANKGESEKETTASSGTFVLVFVCLGVSSLAAYHFNRRRTPVLDQPLLG